VRRGHLRKRSGFTLLEVAIAGTVGVMILTVLLSTSISLQRSMTVTEHYARAANDGNRLLDYVVQDLRRAVRVGSVQGGVYQPLKSGGSAEVDGTSELVISIPDYYASNSETAGDEAFAAPRYARSTLNLLPLFNGNSSTSLDGTVRWNEAVTKVGSVETTRFAPSNLGNGEVQVRYFRAERSDGSGTLCFYRGEYRPGSTAPNFPPAEIAARTSDTLSDPLGLRVRAAHLPATDRRAGKLFTVTTSFAPRFRRSAAPGERAEQSLTILLRNGRRD
jgi:hypothetical protein